MLDILAHSAAPVGTAKISVASYANYNGAVPFNESYVQRGAGDGSGLTTPEDFSINR